ncbi:MAG: bifunctional phosphopantothenoylcysteine decarboxylase/phosphopantothenate--cysteine ligase CoaBC [Solirubrobacteraceae bacterium]
MSRILLGVSGGIAAYKSLELIRLATAAGHSVRVVQTPTSRRFVGGASFEALTGGPALSSEFERDPARGAFPGEAVPTHDPLSHLALVANAEIYLVAPASANTIAKLAQGLADNLLSSCALAATCPVVVAPAMNNHMFEHPATQANLRTLRERGVTVVEPGVGRLASKGERGVGRLAEPERLLGVCEQLLAGGNPLGGEDSEPAPPGASWRGLRVLVTAGGTREPIDSVRFIGNSSSGRMGFALAAAARARGAEVALVAANVALPAPAGASLREVVTAAELERACEEEFAGCDVLLMAAAVADFTPAAPANGKIKKADRDRLELLLEPTTDVLSSLASRRREDQTLVGFAAEHGVDAVAQAHGKLTAKRLDALVVNDISRADIGFDVEANEVTILSLPGGGSQIERRNVPRASKARIAEAICDVVEELRADRGRRA